MTDRVRELPEKVEKALRNVIVDYDPEDCDAGPRCMSCKETKQLRAAILAFGEAEYQRGLRDGAHNPGLDEALNSGDGVYRP